MRREAAALAELQQRRDALQAQRQRQRAQLGALVRAAYQQGGDAPLKVLLSQDRVADANRLLAYHRYVQRDQARRIDALSTDLAALERQLGDLLGLRVKVSHGKSGGQVALHYSTLDQLDLICQRLSGEPI